MRKEYNKLVRDRIPSIIESSGKEFLIRVLSDDEYKRALKRKLIEEATEVNAAESTDELVAELADVVEVIDALIAVLGMSWEEIRDVQKKKRLERGGFGKRLQLMWVEK